jgi:hypothetical protein
LAPTRALFALGLVIAGFGCAGLMMAPLAFAGRTLPPERFGFVSGLLPGIGGSGLLLSGSPSAALVAAGGFRLAYAAAAAASLALALAVARAVPELPPASRHARVAEEAAEVLRLFAGRRLRAPVVLAFVGYPALIGLRGLWAGPYLMDVLGLGIGAAGDVLGLLSLLMIAGPVGFGWLDRRLADRALAIGAIHLAAAAPLLLLAFGGAGAWADIALMPDAKQESAVRLLEDARAWFASDGIVVERVMADDSPAYRSRLFRRVRKARGLAHKRIRPDAPRTHGKAERFIQTSLRADLLARRGLRPRLPELERPRAMPDRLSACITTRPHPARGGNPPSTQPTWDNVLGRDSWSRAHTAGASRLRDDARIECPELFPQVWKPLQRSTWTTDARQVTAEAGAMGFARSQVSGTPRSTHAC